MKVHLPHHHPNPHGGELRRYIGAPLRSCLAHRTALRPQSRPRGSGGVLDLPYTTPRWRGSCGPLGPLFFFLLSFAILDCPPSRHLLAASLVPWRRAFSRACARSSPAVARMSCSCYASGCSCCLLPAVLLIVFVLFFHPFRTRWDLRGEAHGEARG